MKVLLISSHIFGYMEYLAKEIGDRNDELTHFYYNDPPLAYSYTSLLHKIIYGGAKFFGYNSRKRYRERKLKEYLSDKTFDRILVMNPHYLSQSTHIFLSNRTDKYITYLYDSIDKIPAQNKYTKYFDKVYSYEPDDCKKYGFNFITNYIPSQEFKSEKFDFQVFNIMGVDERFADLQRLAQYFQDHNISAKLLLLSDKEYEHFEQIESIMKIQEVFEYIKKCKIMLDLQRPIQNGLTFRVFEAIGNDKKLITTNKSIKNYDFYSEDNILILDMEHIHIPSKFIEEPFKPIPKEILEKYTIRSWVSKVLG